MSFRAVRHVSRIVGLSPAERLVFFEIASVHDRITNLAQTSRKRIAAMSGMPLDDTTHALMTLTQKGFLAWSDRHYTILTLPQPHDADPVPADWRPSQQAIDILIAAYPSHEFSIEAAIHDFISFSNRIGRTIAPSERDGAFVSNISILCDKARSGKVTFAGEGRGNGGASVAALMAGVRPG